MSAIVLEAETRTDVGKGASRRLRRLENKVPGILYGGSKKPCTIHLAHNKVMKALENQTIYSSVFDLLIGGKTERVILKALQRHPYKPVVMHMDLQRVMDKDVLTRPVPLHFINEDLCKGVKEGGKISHVQTQVEIRCQAQHLPEFIEVDMQDVELNGIVHLFDIELPKNVQLTVDREDISHNLPIASVHVPKVIVEEEVKEEEEVAEEAGAEAEAETEASAEPSSSPETKEEAAPGEDKTE